MSYGLKYWNEFADYYDRTVRIEILGKDFTGSSTEVKTLATPLISNYPGDDNNLYNPIIGKQVTINLLSESNFQFIDLHNSDARAHRVDIYRSSVLEFTGWIVPDLFTEPYIAPPYPVSVTARCGLGELKEIDIPESIENLPRAAYTGDAYMPDLYSLIGYYLLEIETSVYLNEAVNIYHDENDETDRSPLADTNINIAAYEGKTVYEAISDILLTFGARLYQMDGEWWVVRAKEMAETLTVRRWTMSRTASNTFTVDTSKLTTFLVSRPAGNQIVNESPQLDINPAWKKFKWIQDLGKYESFLLNSKFQEWENYYVTERNQSWKIKNWIEPGMGFLRRFTETDGSYFAQFGEEGPAYFIYNYIDVKESENQYLSFKLVFDILANTTSIDDDTFRIEVRIVGATTYYLKLNSSDEMVWTTTPSYIDISDILVTYSGARYNRFASNANWKTYEFQTDGFPGDGQFVIRVYGSQGPTIGKSTVLRIKECSILLLDEEKEPYLDELQTEIIVNENNIYKPDEIEIVGGDLPDVTNANRIWENGYRDSLGVPTIEWHERDSSTELPILQLIGEDYKQIFKLPQFKLSIPILSQSTKFDSCIVDYFILPKKYICASAEYDYQSCIFNGIFIEFSVWEGAKWILEDGTWNDDGIWIDDETWKDNDTNLIEIAVSGGYQAHDLSSYFDVDDVIETIPAYGIPGMGGVLREDGVNITPGDLPQTIVVADIDFIPNILASYPLIVSFNATISGVLKTIKITISS